MTEQAFRLLIAYIDLKVEESPSYETEVQLARVKEKLYQALVEEPEPQRKLQPGEAEDLSKLFSNTDELVEALTPRTPPDTSQFNDAKPFDSKKLDAWDEK
jgi:hypothetical protein